MSIEGLPSDLQEDVAALVVSYPPAAPIISRLVAHLQLYNNQAKKRKTIQAEPETSEPAILSLANVSFSSPVRKRSPLSIWSNEIRFADRVQPLAQVSCVFALETPEKLVFVYFC